jgi:hypothetical protein
MVMLAPSRASEKAHARPKPLLAAHTSADLPRIPKSMFVSSIVGGRKWYIVHCESGTASAQVPAAPRLRLMVGA